MEALAQHQASRSEPASRSKPVQRSKPAPRSQPAQRSEPPRIFPHKLADLAPTSYAIQAMDNRLPRRELLTRLGTAGLVLGGAAVGGRLLWDKGSFGLAEKLGERQVRDFTLKQPGDALPQLVISKSSTSPRELTKAAITAMGGMKRFVSRGDIVVVKPNIGWDRTVLQAANTNPEVVATIVELCYDAGAKNVVVTDASCNDANRSFQRSGIWAAAYAKGAEVIIPAEHRFRSMRLRGEVLDEWPVYTPLIHADKVINVPIAKHHNLAKYTGAMKNWYGALGGRRNRLHQNIDTSVADLATFMRPTLTVVDATRILMRNGPQGGNVDDTRVMNQIIASIDQVAADAYGCTLIGQKRENLPYLAMGEARGLGTRAWETLRMREV